VARPELTGVLLVGGASTRFGSPKALARLNGETLAERAWRTLGEACAHRLAVGKAEELVELDMPVLDDGTEVRAAMAGVVAGIRAAPTDVSVVVPVDTPLVTAEVLLELAGVCADVAVPQTGPLPGAYRKSALPVLERRLLEGRLALRDALTELDARTLQVDESLLVNVNTRDELRRLR
jgi:molybdopterin-guanine dinucleotide biosynthesis protein A